MMVLITYDVSHEDDGGPRRLRKLVATCLDYGIRVQYSVFECDITYAQWVELKARLLDIYNPDVDSFRFYKLGKGWKNRVEHHGAKPALDIFGDSLIV